MYEQSIYVAVVDGKVSHVYADIPLKFQVVAWESDDPRSIRVSSEVRPCSAKDKLIAELFHSLKDEPHDDSLLHGNYKKPERTSGRKRVARTDAQPL